MRNARVFVLLAISAGALASVAFVLGSAFGAKARVAQADSAVAIQTPAPLPPGLTPIQPQSAKVDRDQFTLSATSLTRADLLACRNLDAKPRAPRAITTAEFAKAFSGVWLARHRSVHGIPVEMDSAYYLRLGPDGGEAILLDRNNLRQGVFRKALRTTMAANPPAQPLMQTFVNCRYEFIDQYLKVSDTVPVQTLLAATATKLAKPGTAPPTLQQAWRAMIDTGYFSKRSGVGPGVRLGDRKRVALLFNGLKTTEDDIEKGTVPGGEYQLPMVVGGFFKVKLTSVTGDNGMPSVTMNVEAEYAGTGVNLNPDTIINGIENGTFMGEGNDFVAAGRGAYMTSDCGAKNGLMEPSMVFERYVIGM